VPHQVVNKSISALALEPSTRLYDSGVMHVARPQPDNSTGWSRLLIVFQNIKNKQRLKIWPALSFVVYVL